MASRLVLLTLLLTCTLVSSFHPLSKTGALSQQQKMSATENDIHPFCQLPGDPSLILTTNVDLGDKKLDVMKACSKAIAAATGKPESYVGRWYKEDSECIIYKCLLLSLSTCIENRDKLRLQVTHENLLFR